MALVADPANHLFAVPTHSHSSAEVAGSPLMRSPADERGHRPPTTSAPMSARFDSSRGYQETQHNDEEHGPDIPAREQATDTPLPAQPSPSKGTKRAIDATKSTDAMDTMSARRSPRSPSLRPHTTPPTPQRVHIRDLAHVQSFAHESPRNTNVHYEIGNMPIENIIEMVAGLLTRITATNDMQHEHLHRQMPSPDHPGPISPQTSSVLSFHGKNVPSITIMSYLNRINKYCPTSYEVFLSLLVYFDRMTEKVNAGPMQSLREHSQGLETRNASQAASPRMKAIQDDASQTVTPPASGGLGMADHPRNIPGTPHSRYQDSPVLSSATDPELALSHFFVVDSFNIHRLVIAGVTCASKFFSDIFYTNSRYAKVGGLPLPELNHLELQFLLLNDFRLSVPVEELEAYGTMLVEFYAREVAEQQQERRRTNA